ncbi:MAG TPA: response regulator [Vicinamibacterales bacterium]|nr:response regulator [Vicinamibacterales bacterium]
MKILIVEDDTESRETLKILLELDGHDVSSAQNGHEGWQAFEHEDFPVVISDWLMPEMDGLELCRRIRAADRPNYSYVLLVSALKGKSSYLQGMAAGADDFVSKPYDPDELKTRLIVAARIIGIQERVKRLEGILPTCMYCKKIRDEQDQWVGIEAYISTRSKASFSHGVCPSCYESQVKPELDQLRRGIGS